MKWHAGVIDDLKDQLIIALIRRLGNQVQIPATEIDETGGFVLYMAINPMTRVFDFDLKKKQ